MTGGAAVRDAAAREGTSVSNWLAAAAAQRLRNELLRVALDRWEAEDGPFSDDELLRLLQRDGVPVHTSGAVVAQVWRDGKRQVNLARVLSGIDVASLDEAATKRVGELLAASRTADVADAHVALLVHSDDNVLTSDEPDIRALLRTRKIKAHIVRI